MADVWRLGSGRAGWESAADSGLETGLQFAVAREVESAVVGLLGGTQNGICHVVIHAVDAAKLIREGCFGRSSLCAGRRGRRIMVGLLGTALREWDRGGIRGIANLSRALVGGGVLLGYEGSGAGDEREGHHANLNLARGCLRFHVVLSFHV